MDRYEAMRSVAKRLLDGWRDSIELVGDPIEAAPDRPWYRFSDRLGRPEFDGMTGAERAALAALREEP